jgi:hypothetical protein
MNANALDETARGADLRRCWGCRRLHERSAMRWGRVPRGAVCDPLWHPQRMRVLWCEICNSGT